MDAAEADFAPPGLLIKPKPPKPEPPGGGNFAQLVEDAVVAMLRSKPNKTEHLSKVGVLLRAKRLLPDGKMKSFLEAHCPRVAVEGEYALLASAGASEPAAEGNGESTGEGGSVRATPTKPPGPAVFPTDELDEEFMEEQLIQFVRSQSNGVPNVPNMGTFCIQTLGISMRGKLGRFLQARPHIFQQSADGRNIVTLVDGSAAPRPPAAQQGDELPGAPPLGVLDGSDVAASVLPGAAAAARETRSFNRWDPLTQEIFNFVRSRGVATFAQIDTYVRANCPRLISAVNVPAHAWQSKVFLSKRRNIFRLQGPVVSLASHVPQEDSPPPGALQPAGGGGGGTAKPSPALASPPVPEPFSPAPCPSVGPSARVGSAPAWTSGPADAAAAAAALPGHNPVLDAFIAERKALEELRDDVQMKLASLKALSELRKENAGLRAACVTLGRELLSLKQEFTMWRDALAAGGLGVMAAGNGLGSADATPEPSSVAPPPLPVVPGAGAAQAAEPVQPNGAVAQQPAPQQQLQQQQQQQQMAPAGSAEMAAAAQAAAGAGSGAEAAPASSAPSQDGGILLVGGHDGVSWLDSADFFMPYKGVWSSLPILDQPRSFAAVAATPTDIYVAGGGNGVDWYSTVVRYDRFQGGGGAWQPLAAMNVARGSLAAAVSGGGQLYVFGGGKPKEQFNVVEWYDAAQDRWLIGPALTSRRFALGGATLDSAIYAVGGYNGDSYLTTLERLDPREGRWVELEAEMGSKRGGHACVAAGGLLYALGGFNSQQAIPHCEVFDPRANSWRPLADMADSRAYGSAAVVGGEVYAVGGLQSDMQTHAILIERYNPLANAWEHVELPSNANPRRSFLAACGLE